MNVNDVVVLFVSVMLCGVVGASAGPETGVTASAQPTTDGGLGGEISVFMQQRTAAANGSVDSGMWLATFERAGNQSRKRALVERRIETLSTRLDRLERRIRTFSPVETNRSVRHRARWARLAADLEALRTAISELRTAAAAAGVNASGVDRLSNRAASLSVPSVDSATESKIGDSVGLRADSGEQWVSRVATAAYRAS